MTEIDMCGFIFHQIIVDILAVPYSRAHLYTVHSDVIVKGFLITAFLHTLK